MLTLPILAKRLWVLEEQAAEWSALLTSPALLLGTKARKVPRHCGFDHLLSIFRTLLSNFLCPAAVTFHGTLLPMDILRSCSFPKVLLQLEPMHEADQHKFLLDQVPEVHVTAGG